MHTQVFSLKQEKKNVMWGTGEDFAPYSHVFILLFSATWPDGVRRLAKSYLKNPMIVYVDTLDLAVSCYFFFSFFGEEPTFKPCNCK